jgi:hypothetical protein
MPKFAANLTMLFTEAPFLERVALARQAGFNYVVPHWSRLRGSDRATPAFSLLSGTERTRIYLSIFLHKAGASATICHRIGRFCRKRKNCMT